MGLYYRNTFFSTGGKPALTGRQRASQYSCQSLRGVHASRRKRHREPTSDASATNSRRQDCDEPGQDSCQLYNLQPAPDKFYTKSCGTRSLLEGLSYQKTCSIFTPGPGAPAISRHPTAVCHRNAKTQVPPQPGSPQAGPGQDTGDKRELPSSAAAFPGFAASAREGRGPRVPWGAGCHTTIGQRGTAGG